MNRLFLLLGLLLPFFFSCQSNGENNNSNKRSANVELAHIGDSLIYFSCNDITQPSDQSTHYELFITINESKVKVGDLGVCDEINQENFAELNIPEDAIGAVGGETDSIGLYYYVVRVDPFKLVVRRGVAEADSVRYRAIATFTDEDMSINPDINKADLVGLYAAEGASSAYIVLIGLVGKYLSAQLYEYEGVLPPDNEVAMEIPRQTAEVLQGFEVNMADLTFESDLGSGSFEQDTAGVWYMEFDDKRDDQRNNLRLRKVQ